MKKIFSFLLAIIPILGYSQSPDGTFKTLTATMPTTDNYVISEPLPSSYDPKEKFIVVFPFANAGTSPTLNRNSLGAKLIKNENGSSPAIGAICACRKLLSYNGTYFQLVGGGGITNSAANNEIAKSDGTNLVPSGLLSTTLGNLNLGGASTSGSTRTINLDGSSSSVGLTILSKGAAADWESDFLDYSFVLTNDPTHSTALENFQVQMSAGSLQLSSTISPLIIKSADGTADNAHITLLTGNGISSSSGNIYLDTGTPAGGSTYGNISLFDQTGISYGGGEKVIYIHNDVTAPSSNPSAGFILYADRLNASHPTVRLPSGTVIDLAAGGSGVTSVAETFTGGLISVAGSPITTSGTLALTVAGTSGGIPYFSSTSAWASSALLAANALMIGGGAGVAPSTTTTGSGILTWLGTPSSANLASALTDETGTGADVFAGSPAFTGTPTLGTLGYSDTGILWSMQSSTNSYNQLVLQNTSSGTSASTNLIISSDNGTSTTHYLEVGKNSSGFSNGAGSFNFANASYLDDASDDLVIGTLANKTLHFVTNNSTTDRLSIDGNGVITQNTPSWTATDNNQFSWNSSVTGISRPTASDLFGGYNFVSTITANAATIDAQGLIINTNFSVTGGVSIVNNNGSTINRFETYTLSGMTPGTYTGVACTTNGSGTGALFTIVVNASAIINSVTNTTAGSGYKLGETVTFSAAQIGAGGSGSATIAITATTTNSLASTASAATIINALPDVNGLTKRYIDFRASNGTTSLASFTTGKSVSGIPTFTFNDAVGTAWTSDGTTFTLSRAFNVGGNVNFASGTVTLPNGFTMGSFTSTTGTALITTTGLITSNNTISSIFDATGNIINTGALQTSSGSITNAGSGGTNGTYTSVALTGGTGSGVFATIVVSSNHVTSVTITTRGSGYTTADVLSASSGSIGGTTGFQWTVSSTDFTGSSYVLFRDNRPVTDSKTAHDTQSFLVDGTYNQTANATGNFYGFHYKPTLSAILGKVYPILVETTTGLNGFGLTSPIATVHNGGSSGWKTSTSSAGTLTLDKTATTWVFTGTTTTWTLPALSGNTDLTYLIVNRGSGNLTLSRAGSDNIYTTSSVTTVTISAGQKYLISNDGSFWLAAQMN